VRPPAGRTRPGLGFAIGLALSLRSAKRGTRAMFEAEPRGQPGGILLGLSRWARGTGGNRKGAGAARGPA
jgi:hypothetical protein